MPQSSQDATCLPQRHGWHDKTQQTLNWGTLRCLTLHSKNDGSFFLGISPTFTKPISKIAKSRDGSPLEVAPESDQVEALDQASNCEATCGNLFINSPECTYNIIQCILTVAVFCCNSYGSKTFQNTLLYNVAKEPEWRHARHRWSEISLGVVPWWMAKRLAVFRRLVSTIFCTAIIRSDTTLDPHETIWTEDGIHIICIYKKTVLIELFKLPCANCKSTSWKLWIWTVSKLYTNGLTWGVFPSHMMVSTEHCSSIWICPS